MAFSSVFLCLTSVFTRAVASETQVIRSNRLSSGTWSEAVVNSNGQLGLPFWRRLRVDLEAKKKHLAADDEREYSQLSAAVRRDLLWNAVRAVDDKFHSKYACEVAKGTAYSKQLTLLQGQTSYSKASIGSARECALMCAADSFNERSKMDLACKSFVYNQTGYECTLFNFAQTNQKALIKDTCCTTGPPCSLDSMRQEIQKAFEIELKRALLSQRRVENERLADKLQEARQGKSAVTKVTKSPAAKAEKKVVVRPKIVAPRMEQDVATTQTKHTAPKVEQKPVVQKVEREPVMQKVERKPVVRTSEVVTKSEPVQPLSDQFSPVSATHVSMQRRHWRLFAIIGGLLVVMLSLAWGVLAAVARASFKQPRARI